MTLCLKALGQSFYIQKIEIYLKVNQNFQCFANVRPYFDNDISKKDKKNHSAFLCVVSKIFVQISKTFLSYYHIFSEHQTEDKISNFSVAATLSKQNC